jgi:hypothetical protein
MANRKEPLLNFRTLFDRDTIIIDGVSYEIRNREELTVLDYELFNAQKIRLDELVAKMQESVTDEDLEEIEGLTRIIIKMIFIMIPDETAKQLSWPQRIQVISVFTSLPMDRLQKASPLGDARAQQMDLNETGAK